MNHTFFYFLRFFFLLVYVSYILFKHLSGVHILGLGKDQSQSQLPWAKENIHLRKWEYLFLFRKSPEWFRTYYRGCWKHHFVKKKSFKKKWSLKDPNIQGNQTALQIATDEFLLSPMSFWLAGKNWNNVSTVSSDES